jgi:hypothetical protein
MHVKKLLLLAIIMVALACSGGDQAEYILVDGEFDAGSHIADLSLRDANDVPYPEGMYLTILRANDFQDWTRVLITSEDYHEDIMNREAKLMVFKYGGPAQIAFDIPEPAYVRIKLIGMPGLMPIHVNSIDE